MDRLIVGGRGGLGGGKGINVCIVLMRIDNIYKLCKEGDH